jgi:hypothetical protein
VKLLAGIVLYPIGYFGWIALTVGLGGALAGIVAALVLPLLGYTALLWQHRRRKVSEDVRLFLQVVRHPMMRDFLSERRAALAAELEALDAQWSSIRAGAYRDESNG